MKLRPTNAPTPLTLRARQLYAAWQREHGLRTLLAGSAIVGVVFPAFYWIYLPMTVASERHFWLHILVGVVAWLVFAAVALLPPLRRVAWALHPIAGTTMLASAVVITIDGHNASLYVAAMMLIIFALPLFYVSVINLGVVYAITFAFHVGYGLTHGQSGPTFLTTLATFGAAYVIALAGLVISTTSKLAEVTEVARVEALQAAEIERLRLRDALTGLPNAAALLDMLPRMLQHHDGVALILVEFDRPDLLAHRVGVRRMAALLVAAARRLGAAIPADGVLFRYRDHAFAVVAPALSRGDADRSADDLGMLLAAPFDDVARSAFATATVAAAFAPLDADDAAGLLSAADERLIFQRRRREAAGTSDDVDLERASALATDLPAAIERGELVLHYQPGVRAADGTVVGVEALVRWQHPHYGLLLPDAFIDVAEREGLIVPLGEWVMREAAHSAASLVALGMPLEMAFNVSARQFRDPSFSDRLREIVRAAGIAPAMMTMELTESTAMDRTADTQRVLDRCNTLGVRIALDDFGTGYSSLAYLKLFPIDTVKIDRTFVAGLPDESDAAIARAIVALARALDCTVQAEGVETEAQAAWLRDAGCDILQGYHLALPMPFEALVEWLEARACSARAIS